jgi:hypothetical protein
MAGRVDEALSEGHLDAGGDQPNVTEISTS